MGQRVLIVDDNDDVREILGRRLMRAGFDVSSAADGQQALAKLRTGHWDLILLDLMMPVMDGFEFLAAAQLHPFDPPVVVITQYDDPANFQRAMDLGATSYVGKSSALDRSFASTLGQWVGTTRKPRGDRDRR
jgi:CheY-like chemotaxis protein